MNKQDTTSIDEQIKEIHNRFHGRISTHKEVAKHARWTPEELNGVCRQDEHLFYAEIKALISDQVAKARIEELQYIREFWGQAKDDTLSSKPFNFVALSDIDNRIAQLRSTPNGKE